MVTLDDLTLNPNMNPTEGTPPFLLIGGGGGGGSSGGNDAICVASAFDGGEGGVAIASTTMRGEADGQRGGGNDDCGGFGGKFGAFGGTGAPGGDGQGCSSRTIRRWTNTGSTQLDFTAGEGIKGGGGNNLCDAGGGGGGGWGGADGGRHGNFTDDSCGGGGGSSIAITSTKESDIAPSDRPDNPCGGEGCLVIRLELKIE